MNSRDTNGAGARDAGLPTFLVKHAHCAAWPAACQSVSSSICKHKSAPELHGTSISSTIVHETNGSTYVIVILEE